MCIYICIYIYTYTHNGFCIHLCVAYMETVRPSFQFLQCKEFPGQDAAHSSLLGCDFPLVSALSGRFKHPQGFSRVTQKPTVDSAGLCDNSFYCPNGMAWGKLIAIPFRKWGVTHQNHMSLGVTNTDRGSGEPLASSTSWSGSYNVGCKSTVLP